MRPKVDLCVVQFFYQLNFSDEDSIMFIWWPHLTELVHRVFPKFSLSFFFLFKMRHVENSGIKNMRQFHFDDKSATCLYKPRRKMCCEAYTINRVELPRAYPSVFTWQTTRKKLVNMKKQRKFLRGLTRTQNVHYSKLKGMFITAFFPTKFRQLSLSW